MRKFAVFTLLLLCPILAVPSLFAQANNGSIGGVVEDATKALIPGVTVTLTNTQTGIVDTRLTNEAGAYNFPSVPPGTYKIEGGLTGFTSDIKTGIGVGTAAQLRVDLTLRVGAAPGTSVTVSVESGNSQLRESSASVGEVLDSEKIHNLPNLGGNVLDLLTVLPGFRVSAAGPGFNTVGGMALDTVNTTINGLSTNSSRDSANFVGYQAFTTTVVNPDLVGEIRLILAPVDAELGRGNAQVQIQTRSGTNKYTGSVNWNIQNSAMDANSWLNNHTPTVVNGIVTSNSTKPNWQNRNQITASYGGPIIKNKTFFFALYDYQNVNGRAMVTNTVYTDSAKQGIWKYYPGWNPLNAAPNNVNSACIASGTPTGSQVVVDINGNPLPSVPNAICGQPPVTLQCYSVFGNQKFDWQNNSMVPVNPAADCPGGTFLPGPANALQTWDLRRPGNDSTGYISRILKLMPLPNNWSSSGAGDGLNTAANRYLRGRKGSNALNAQFGVAYSAGDQNNRKSMNIKIDHNFNKSNRVSFQWTYEWDDGIGSGAAPWDGGIQGSVRRRPQVLTINGTSTLSANLVNEARFGLNYSSEWNSPAWANQNNETGTETAKSYLLQGGTNATNGKVYPIIFNPGATAGGFMAFNAFDIGNTSPLWNYADTIRWTHGKHSFSFGGEYRRPMTTGYNSSAYATSSPGNPTGAPVQDLSSINNYVTELPGLLGGTRGSSVTLLNLLSGSVASANTGYWIDGYENLAKGTWQDTTTEVDIIPTADKVYGHQTRRQISNEWSFFAKDDFKIARGLTLNLGVRYDLNMSPYLGDGLTNRLYQDGIGLYGPARPTSGDLLSNWMVPGDANTGLYFAHYGSFPGGVVCESGLANPNGIPTSNCNPNFQSQIQFVGPGTPSPKDTLIPQNGRVSPAIGFAWQVPWFGEGKTTMRGGFQRTYGGAGSAFSGGLLSGPGGGDFFTAGINVSDPAINSILTTGGPAGVGRALNLADLNGFPLVPGVPTRAPNSPLPLVANLGIFGATGISYSMYSPTYVTPYTDNFTLSITRQISSKYTVDVRFVDTLGRKLAGGGGGLGSAGSIDLNQVNVYHNPELFQALENTRKGLNDPLFDQMLVGLNLNAGQTGYGAVGTVVNSNVTINGVTTNTPVLQRGSAHIRRAMSGNLANGNYAGVMATLLAFNTGGSGLQTLPTGVPSMNGRALRNGCDRLANGLTAGFNATDISGNPIAITPRCLPENYLITNPSFGQAMLAENFGHSNYQSGQVQFTARPVQGVSIQGTYSISKTMALPGNGYTDPLNRQLDYSASLNSVGQEFRSNSVIELPMGPNKLMFGNSSGWVARAIERWQTSFIFVLPTGALRSIVGPNTMYANGRPDVVGPWDNPKGEVDWNGTNNGNYFGSDNPYQLFVDPQCSNGNLVQQAPTSLANADPVGFNLATGANNNSSCTLRGMGKVVPAGTPGAVMNSAGNAWVLPLLQTPLPGKQGTLGANTMHTVARWSLDASISKSFRISESKSLSVRVDSTNIMNHPTPGDPVGLGQTNSLAAGSNFGTITSKSGNRSFQASARFSF